MGKVQFSKELSPFSLYFQVVSMLSTTFLQLSLKKHTAIIKNPIFMEYLHDFQYQL